MDISKPTGSKTSGNKVAILSTAGSSYTLCLQSFNKKPACSGENPAIDKRKEQHDRHRAALMYLLTHNLFFYLNITGQVHLIQKLFFAKKTSKRATFILARLRRSQSKKNHKLRITSHIAPITFFDLGFKELRHDPEKLAQQKSTNSSEFVLAEIRRSSNSSVCS